MNARWNSRAIFTTSRKLPVTSLAAAAFLLIGGLLALGSLGPVAAVAGA